MGARGLGHRRPDDNRRRLAYGELGTMFPQAGGEYVYLKEAFGPLVAFLYGFAYSLVTTAGTLAFLAIAAAGYLGMNTSWDEALKTGTWAGPLEAKLFSISVVAVLTFLNCRGVKLSAGVMDILTSSKIMAMLLLVVLGFAIGHGSSAHFVPLFSGETKPIVFAIGAALVPMAYAYSGWNASVLMAEEVRRPERAIPLSLIFGTLLVTLVYVLMNAVYIYAVPLHEIVGTKTVAKLAASNLFGDWAKILAQGLVALSVLGTLSATLLSNPRTVFAMGRDRALFQVGGKHPSQVQNAQRGDFARGHRRMRIHSLGQLRANLGSTRRDLGGHLGNDRVLDFRSSSQAPQSSAAL